MTNTGTARKPSSVLEIVEKHMTDNGFDGITNGRGCCCQLDDLMPCENPDAGCAVGHVQTIHRGIGFRVVVPEDKPDYVPDGLNEA